MKRLFRPYLALLVLGSLMLTATSCGDDEPKPLEEEELITTLRITLEPVGKTQTVVGIFRDVDGDGGNPATANTMRLEANTTYNATIKLFDESKNTPVELTNEIKEEADEHEFFYQALDNLALSISKTDRDNSQRPIGLQAQIVTTNTSTGKLRITLKHQPNLKVGPNEPNREQTGLTRGETDIQAEFPVIVE
ncbi:hypothetical protein ABID22_001103 [Pontibacter aydingkolensis]|uniref:Type 1 periplasmic binding fold superfamily protein n=1 Tax=Pontibacter aydingkolensis TaxID=1911536 RepID=A0ABS7CT39_9BACT|nr:hypothetical protein [Pontibacter aydingkolensis]MBW7467013.1 hypothetical protein [Pontibacter aydingkolensis]